MKARLCRWLGHTIGKVSWLSSNRVTIGPTSRRCTQSGLSKTSVRSMMIPVS